MFSKQFFKNYFRLFDQIIRTYTSCNSTNTESKFVQVKIKDARRFIIDALLKVHVCLENAEQQAAVMIAADSRGIYTHGMNRLEAYMKDISSDRIDCNAKPTVEMDGRTTAWVDGQNGLGVVVANFCMQIAIKKAKEHGLGFVTCKRSNHYGISGYYTQQAVDVEMIGFSATNTSPLVAPVGAKKAAIGTNPLSFAAPASKDDFFNLDMTTSVTSLGHIELLRKKGLPIPEGLAQDENGKPLLEHKPDVHPILLPLGGKDGHKGYGLSLIVESLCGILGGAHFGPYIRKMGQDYEGEADLSHCFLVLNPYFFAPSFQSRLSTLMDYIRQLEPVDPKKPIIVPGDLERRNICKSEKDGLLYMPNMIEYCHKLASELQIRPIEFKTT